MLDRILRITGLADDQMLNVYQYGSRVYGTAGRHSDYDFLVVADCEWDGREFRNGDCNVVVYTPSQFQHDLSEHKPVAVECHFAPQPFRLMERRSYQFAVNRIMLRHEYMRKSSLSWVKAKKKLTVEPGQEMLGVKSLWHSMRLLMFATEMARTGCLTNYAVANPLWEEIKTAGTDWSFLRDLYKPIYNGLASEFRRYAEKVASAKE